MKRVITYLCIFIILCFLADLAINYSIAKQINDQSPYCLSFASIGANLLESRFDCWAKIKPVRTFEEMDQELEKILTLLDLPVNKQNFLHQEQNGNKTLHYKLLRNDQSYYFSLQTESQNTYFLLSTISAKNDKKQRMEEKKLKSALNCKSYFQYRGIINARLDKDGQKDLLQVITKSMQVKILDQYEEDNLISMTGSSAKLESFVEPEQASGKSYNLQLALRSDQKKNQTYIYFGSPLLLTNY